jgi:phosphatidylserine decarboxylase
LFRVYSRAFGANLDEAEPRSGGYPSFDAFFTRTLRDGARQVSADALVSPSDGVLSAAGRVDAGARLFVKGQAYEVGELTGDPQDSARYTGGDFAVIYLAPGDYHRVHSPADGQVTLARKIPGDLYPVNRIGELHVPRLFVRNSRVQIVLETRGLGRISVVMVGAVIVGRISVSGVPAPDVPAGEHRFEPARSVARGDELGIFHLGSTVVLLVEPGVSVARPLGKIRYGDSLLRGA